MSQDEVHKRVNYLDLACKMPKIKCECIVMMIHLNCLDLMLQHKLFCDIKRDYYNTFFNEYNNVTNERCRSKWYDDDQYRDGNRFFIEYDEEEA